MLTGFPFPSYVHIKQRDGSSSTSDLNCNGYLYLALEIKELTAPCVFALPQNHMQIHAVSEDT